MRVLPAQRPHMLPPERSQQGLVVPCLLAVVGALRVRLLPAEERVVVGDGDVTKSRRFAEALGRREREEEDEPH